MNANKKIFLLAAALCFPALVDAKTVNPAKPLQEQFAKKAKYKINQPIDLGGKELIVPAQSKLVFKGGCIKNGTVRLENAKLQGDVRLYTRVSGSVVNKELKTDWFVSGIDIDSLFADSVFYLTGYQTLRFAPGDYVCSMRKSAQGLRLSGVVIDGNGCSITAKNSGTALESLFILKNATDVVMKNFRLDGGKFTDPTEGARHNIYLSACKNITVEDIVSDNAFTDGLYIRDCNGVTVNNFSATHCGRQGCSITSGKNIRISNSTFADTYRTAPKSGIDIEPSLKNDVIDSVLISRCRFTGNASSGIVIHLKAQDPVYPCNINVEDCYFENNNVNVSLCSTEKSGNGRIIIRGCTLKNSKAVSLQSKCYSATETPEVTVENCTIENANLGKGTDVREAATLVSVHNVSSSPVKGNYGNIHFKNLTLRQDAEQMGQISRMVCLYDQASGNSHLENVEIDGIRIDSYWGETDSYSAYDIYVPSVKGDGVKVKNYSKKLVLSKSVSKALTPCSEYVLKGGKHISLKKQVRPDVISSISIFTEEATTCSEVCSGDLKYETGEAYQSTDIWSGSFVIENQTVYVKSGTVVRGKKTLIKK